VDQKVASSTNVNSQPIALAGLPDALGVTRKMQVEKWAWLIGLSDADDTRLLEWARSFATHRRSRPRARGCKHPPTTPSAAPRCSQSRGLSVFGREDLFHFIGMVPEPGRDESDLIEFLERNRGLPASLHEGLLQKCAKDLPLGLGSGFRGHLHHVATCNQVPQVGRPGGADGIAGSVIRGNELPKESSQSIEGGVVANRTEVLRRLLAKSL